MISYGNIGLESQNLSEIFIPISWSVIWLKRVKNLPGSYSLVYHGVKWLKNSKSWKYRTQISKFQWNFHTHILVSDFVKASKKFHGSYSLVEQGVKWLKNDKSWKYRTQISKFQWNFYTHILVSDLVKASKKSAWFIFSCMTGG